MSTQKTFIFSTLFAFIYLFQLSNGQTVCYSCPNLNFNPSNCVSITCPTNQECCLNQFACCDPISTTSTFSAITEPEPSRNSEPHNMNTINIIIIVCVLVGTLLIALIFIMLFIFCKPFNRKVKSLFSSREKPLRFSDAISSTETSIDSVTSQNSNQTQKVIHPPSDITSLGII